MQGQVRCCQIWGRRRKREENHTSGPWCLCCLYKFLAELYSMASILIQTNTISSPAVWITKMNKSIRNIFFTSFFIPSGQQRFAVIGASARSGSYWPHLIFLLISHMFIVYTVNVYISASLGRRPILRYRVSMGRHTSCIQLLASSPAGISVSVLNCPLWSHGWGKR